MAERDTEASSGRPVLLAGAGRRAREAGAALAALSALDGTGEKRREPLAELGVGDLEELLAQRPVEGLLILESDRVPPEDIGFVRRFLERHAGWRLAVIGEDPKDARTRALLALGRSQWLPWPPDLEQLRALLPAPPAASSAPGQREDRSSERRTARRGALPGPAGAPGGPSLPVPNLPVPNLPVNGGIDVARLLEELLAGAALQGEGSTRYQFRGQRTPVLQRERGTLQQGLEGLLELARRCAGSDGLVKAAVDPAGDAVRIGIDFPSAGLPEKDLPRLLDQALVVQTDPDLAQGVAAARHGAALLREVGGRVELSGAEPGRVRCEVRLSAPPSSSARPSRASKPEDPFA